VHCINIRFIRLVHPSAGIYTILHLRLLLLHPETEDSVGILPLLF